MIGCRKNLFKMVIVIICTSPMACLGIIYLEPSNVSCSPSTFQRGVSGQQMEVSVTITNWGNETLTSIVGAEVWFGPRDDCDGYNRWTGWISVSPLASGQNKLFVWPSGSGITCPTDLPEGNYYVCVKLGYGSLCSCTQVRIEAYTEEPEQCCFFYKLCEDLAPSECHAQAGYSMGPGTSCPPDRVCPGYTEACCGPFGAESGVCDNMDAGACVDLWGEPQGYATKCLGDNDLDGWDDACGEPPLWGCCDPVGQCTEETWLDCTFTFHEGEHCLGDSNNDGYDDLCVPPNDECVGDLNDDGSVSLSDRMYIDSLLMQVGYPYRIYEGDSLWDASADLNGDGVISLADRMVIDGILMQVGPPYISPC
jgi:hypothetical protein